MKAVIFDCFGVLYLNAGELFYQNHIPQYELQKDRLRELDRQCDAGFISQDELISQVAELSGLDRSLVASRIGGSLRRNDELLNFAQRLRGDNKVGLLSNISSGAIDKYFDKKERGELFDAVVLSGDAGMLKPFPEIYQLTAQKLGTSPSNCLFIDDSEDNCAGADAAGMRPILYSSNQQTIIDIKKYLPKLMP